MRSYDPSYPIHQSMYAAFVALCDLQLTSWHLIARNAVSLALLAKSQVSDQQHMTVAH